MLTHHLAGAVRPALPRLGCGKRWGWRGPQDLHDYITFAKGQRSEARQALRKLRTTPDFRWLIDLVSSFSKDELITLQRRLTEMVLEDQGLTKQDYMGTGFHEDHGVVDIYAINKGTDTMSEVELAFVTGSEVIFRCLLDGSVYTLTRRCSEALYSGGYPEYFVQVDNPNADPQYLIEAGLPLRDRQPKIA